jgi:hypothetical protein
MAHPQFCYYLISQSRAVYSFVKWGLANSAKAIVGLRPSFSSHVRWGERGAPVDSLRGGYGIDYMGASLQGCAIRLAR